MAKQEKGQNPKNKLESKPETPLSIQDIIRSLTRNVMPNSDFRFNAKEILKSLEENPALLFTYHGREACYLLSPKAMRRLFQLAEIGEKLIAEAEKKSSTNSS